MVSDPRLMPSVSRVVVDCETFAPVTIGGYISLMEYASVKNLLNHCVCDDVIGLIVLDHVPTTNPEIQLMMLGIATWFGGR